jgi:hypothetical protein
MKEWLQRALILAAGFALGFLLRPAQAQRFLWNNEGNVLDTKTGQVCIPVAAEKNGTNLPICLDVYKHY